MKYTCSGYYECDNESCKRTLPVSHTEIKKYTFCQHIGKKIIDIPYEKPFRMEPLEEELFKI